MKNSKKMFILTEAVLMVLVIVLAFVMLWGKNEKDRHKVSVIVQNSDDTQWSAFKYGLKMAAEDMGIELYVVSTGGTLTVEEQERLIQWEISNGARAVIVEPVPGADTEAMLKTIEKKVPVMLVEHTAVKDETISAIPTTQPDNYAMGAALAQELLKDYDGKLKGKTLGLLSECADSEAAISRLRGFVEALKGEGAKFYWTAYGSDDENGEGFLSAQAKVDMVIALDDPSLKIAGEYAALKNLHGALVYGIGNSTESVYYLDVGLAECLIVPDEFNVGYESLTEVAKELGHYFYKMQDKTVSYTVLRRDTLFSMENQDLLFTMSQ